MLKKWGHVFLFLLAFQMEVRVRAAGDSIQLPEGCLKTKESCAVQSVTSPFRFKKDDVKIHATAGSTLSRQSDHQWKFIKGALWVEQGSGLEIETLYGSLKAFQGEYWVVEQSQRLLVRNVSAALKVNLRDGTELNVPEGFEFWMGGLNSEGKSEFGMIEPIKVASHLRLWNDLFEGDKEQFKEAVRHQKENWGDLAEKSGNFYKALVQREVASIAEQERQEDLKKQRQTEKVRRLKQLFYERTIER